MFLTGFFLGFLSASAVGVLCVKYRKTVFGACRFVLSLSSESAIALEGAQSPTPKALDQTMYLEVVQALQGLGATKAQALKSASDALTVMTNKGEAVNADALLMKAMMGVGK